ncbi:uncharacterized protein MELLADRAFT_90002 [Melampsora larici-populina 98AG31]|uniref:Uncharacterized protein n=1 Tax=Melampsora larici-populina (strain 98AG31 / pathotype 3-4-7) TaxID=747676 RepID=F4RVD9_MELLP|nr:uncharacterized protein MELLADRAFT_90002 [Melampsora larici-populina 98AG31]EGG03686.1 hypothetical protein MELLADRAFT_90002 [Melampsora larici-populina 98AG31]
MKLSLTQATLRGRDSWDSTSCPNQLNWKCHFSGSHFSQSLFFVKAEHATAPDSLVFLLTGTNFDKQHNKV